MAYLKVNDIYKTFGTNKVLKGISFDLNKGEVLAIIGASGSGKTTLLRCITFLERADKGVLQVGDTVLFDMSRVHMEDGSLTSSLCSPLCRGIRYLRARMRYTSYMTGPLVNTESAEKTEFSLPVSDNCEEYAEFLTNPFISKQMRNSARDIYISKRRNELMAAQEIKNRAMNNDDTVTLPTHIKPESVIRKELKDIAKRAKDNLKQAFCSHDAADYARILCYKDCPDNIAVKARRYFLRYYNENVFDAPVAPLSRAQAIADKKRYAQIRKNGWAELKKMKSEAYIRSRRLHFGLVFQSFNLFPQYNVLDNVTMAPRLMIREELRMLGYFSRIEKLAADSGKDNTTAIARLQAKADIIANTLAKEDVEAAKLTARQCLSDGKGINKREYIIRRRNEIERYAYSLLEQVGLADKVRAYPCELSGGQCQRVAIARALAMRPNILCFDEPTSALDPELTGEVLKVIKGLKSSDRTMIVVTHEMGFAREVADKVLFMSGGVVEESGTPEEVFDNPRSEVTRAFLNKSKEGF